MARAGGEVCAASLGELSAEGDGSGDDVVFCSAGSLACPWAFDVDGELSSESDEEDSEDTSVLALRFCRRVGPLSAFAGAMMVFGLDFRDVK